MKIIQTSAVIIHDKQQMIICQPFGKKKNTVGGYDLPKGKIDAGETPEQGAVREVREETGMNLEISGLIKLGYFDDYTSEKGIHIYSYQVSQLPSIKSLHCESYIDKEKHKPEMIGYKIVELEEIHWLYKVLQKVLVKLDLNSLKS